MIVATITIISMMTANMMVVLVAPLALNSADAAVHARAMDGIINISEKQRYAAHAIAGAKRSVA